MKSKIKSLVERLKEFFLLDEEVDEETTKLRFFKEEGIAPLVDVDFNEKDVFEMRLDSFQTSGQVSDLYEKLLTVSTIFELYLIPTTVNIQKDLEEGKIQTDYKEYIAKLKDHLSKEEYQYTRAFLITNKEVSEEVVQRFKDMSFLMIGVISEEEAKGIVVSGVEGYS
ncbi:hypothetical protein QTG56_26100 (plasmid) [Rossellomorea sp. AcN35-11]|nr:hypothetical protein [Rossellomorea aquimaris]WJV32090.1 hypothetical protein QTG56_26100 [Rossellomorea sp. AcN35-11]